MLKDYQATINIKAEKFDTSVEQIIRYDLKYVTNKSKNNNDLEFLLTNDMGTEVVHVGDWIATTPENNSFVISDQNFKKYYELTK